MAGVFALDVDDDFVNPSAPPPSPECALRRSDSFQTQMQAQLDSFYLLAQETNKWSGTKHGSWEPMETNQTEIQRCRRSSIKRKKDKKDSLTHDMETLNLQEGGEDAKKIRPSLPHQPPPVMPLTFSY
eukprot:m.67012 g.67012  ORF g.67012 m.67012 type:complete len:128 (+) comp35428_c0_seq1:347-730(+)